jgi:hypothetical protein
MVFLAILSKNTLIIVAKIVIYNVKLVLRYIANKTNLNLTRKNEISFLVKNYYYYTGGFHKFCGF